MFLGHGGAFLFLECVDAGLEFLVLPAVSSHTANQHRQRVRHVEVHAKAKGGAHAGGPFNEHPEQEAESQQDKVALTFSENHREGSESVGLGCDELNAAFGQLDGQENRHTRTDNGARDNAHDVPFRDVIGSVTDVEAVFVIADHGS